MLWKAPNDLYQSIKDKVEESHQKREQSKQLLEIAKTGIERAIEQTEEVEIEWINQRFKTFGIELVISD